GPLRAPSRRGSRRANPRGGGDGFGPRAQPRQAIHSDRGRRAHRDLRRPLSRPRRGGAREKRARGEPLTSEEEEAIGRWQRLGRVRKVAALGAFTLGTFGLGFTL